MMSSLPYVGCVSVFAVVLLTTPGVVCLRGTTLLILSRDFSPAVEAMFVSNDRQSGDPLAGGGGVAGDA